MFRERYKQANDAIPADDALMEKVLQAVREKKKPPLITRKIYTVGTVAAAFAVVAATLFTVPSLMDHWGKAPDDFINQTTAITASTEPSPESTAKAAAASPTPAVPSTLPTKQPSVSPAPRPSGTSKFTLAPKASKAPVSGNSQKNSLKTAAPEKNKSISAPSSATGAPLPAPENKPESSPAPTPLATAPVVMNTESGVSPTQAPLKKSQAPLQDSPDLYINQRSVKEESYILNDTAPPTSGGGGSAAMPASGSTADSGENNSMLSSAAPSYMTGAAGTEWTVEKYYHYLGFSLDQKLVLPSDMKNTSPASRLMIIDENEQLEDDAWIFTYTGDKNRCLSIETTKRDSQVQQELSSKDSIKTDLAGTPAVIIGSGDCYDAYFSYQGVNFTVSSTGLTQEELGSVLLSIVK